MSSGLKAEAPFEAFAALDIRLGRVVGVRLANGALKKSYALEIDFGKFGKRMSVGRFTSHAAEEIQGKLVVAVLNFAARDLGEISECLVLGVQFPGADSGEATILTPLANAKIGGKVF